MTCVLKKWWLLRSAWEHREDEICLNFISQPFLHFFYILIETANEQARITGLTNLTNFFY
jgi:hypothetical protein